MTVSFASPRARSGWYAASAIACSLLVAGCAEASPGVDNTSPARVAQVHQVCRSTMGYQPIDVEYRACVDSLMGSLAKVDHADAIEHGRQLCTARGLHPGTPDFALCVVDHEQ
jgi:hypothetical protein